TNRVELSTTADSYGILRPKITFEVGSYTWAALEKARIVATTLLKNAGCEEVEPVKLDESYNTAAHIMGTCRMGHDPATSVVTSGVYRSKGAQPDGDSIRFYPTDSADWDKIRGPHKVRANAHGGAQLRLDGIDALETHYSPRNGGVGITHQPLDLAQGAASEL